MTPSSSRRSVCVLLSSPVPTPSERFAPVCSPSASRLFLAPSTVVLTAFRVAAVLPNRTVRLQGGTFTRASTIGSAPQTR